MEIDLSKFIKNLKEFKNKPLDALDGNSKRPSPIKKIFFLCLKELAKRQISDTLYSRALIVKVYGDMFGYDSSEVLGYEHQWFFWEQVGFSENVTRRRDNAYKGKDMDFDHLYSGDELDLEMTFRDPAIVNQEQRDPRYPSENHPRGMGGFSGGHITTTSKLLNSGLLNKHEDYKEISDIVVKTVEKYLMKS